MSNVKFNFEKNVVEKSIGKNKNVFKIDFQN